MTLGDKLRSLRVIEGSMRGLGRPLTQSEVVAMMKKMEAEDMIYGKSTVRIDGRALHPV